MIKHTAYIVYLLYFTEQKSLTEELVQKREELAKIRTGNQ